MAVYRLFPSKDATLYTKIEDMNTGADAMLELGSDKFGNAMRSIIAFDQTEVNSTIDDVLQTTGSYTASLNVYVANAENLGEDSRVFVLPVAESWSEGIGHYADAPYNSLGVSWKYRNGATIWDTSTYGSLDDGNTVGGGTWKTTVDTNYVDGVYDATPQTISITSSYDHTYRGSVDISADVTPFVRATYHDETDNFGLLLRMDVEEFSTGSMSYMQLFSRDTNTIYYPHLEFKWDDSSYSSTLTELSDLNSDILVKNIRESYADTGKVKFRIHARPKYPTKVFRTTNTYLTNYKLPQESYWGIKDEATGEMFIDFDTVGTKISADNTSSYFEVYMDNLFVERYYRLVIKTTIDGSVEIIESDKPFKIETNG